MSSKRWSTLIRCSLAFSRENVNVAGTSASASSLGISAVTIGWGWVGVIVGAGIPGAPLRALFLTLSSGFSDRSLTAFLFTAATGASHSLLLPEEDFSNVLVASLAEVRVVGIMSWQQSYKIVRRERGFLWRPIQFNLALSCSTLPYLVHELSRSSELYLVQLPTLSKAHVWNRVSVTPRTESITPRTHELFFTWPSVTNIAVTSSDLISQKVGSVPQST